MQYLTAAVVLVGLVAGLNLLLTVAVIRRLRRHEAQRNMLPAAGLSAGAEVPDFEAETTTGGKISRASVVGRQSIVAFFSTSCSACTPSLPHLREYISHYELAPSQAIVVISGERDGAGELTEPLDGRSTVVFEESGGPMAQAFQVLATPTFVMIDESGIVTRSVAGSGPLVATG